MKPTLCLVAAVSVVSLVLAGCVSPNPIAEKTTVTEKVFTTVERNLVPVPPVTSDTKVGIDDTENIAKLGYGTYKIGPGIPYTTRADLMPAGYDVAKAKKAATLLRFFTITDIHVTDEESPGQGIVFAPMLRKQGISLYAPLMPYTTQVLNAAITTINAYHKQAPLDLGLALGDMTNTAQYNELRWFIDIMDGKTIAPYSGGKKDPIPGPNNDFADEFKAVGLDPSIPWYAAVGNHDHFWIGSKLFSDDMKKAVVGDKILQMPNVLKEDGYTYSTGTLDGSKPNAPIIGAGRMDKLSDIPSVTPDANRRYLAKDEWMNEFSASTTKPVGHGFDPKTVLSLFNGCYSFLPKANVPLKIIVLDDTQSDNDPPYQEGIYGHGSLDKGRYDWLMAQLQAGQDANQLMVIAAHIPIGMEKDDTPMSWIPIPGAFTTQGDLIDRLKAFPNLILMVAGHRHLNAVKEFPSSDPNHPENGFWQVETKSLREFPEQFRVFEIAVNSDKSVSIIATDVDPVMGEGTVAALGRANAIAANQVYGIEQDPASGVCNAILLKQLTPTMQAVVAKYAAQ